MDNQHRIIKGYRELSQTEIDLINEIKAKGEELEILVNKIDSHVYEQIAAVSRLEEPMKFNEAERLTAAQPSRWVAMAKTDLQTGIMKLVRAIAQPTSF